MPEGLTHVQAMHPDRFRSRYFEDGLPQSPKPEQHNEGVNIPLVEIAAIIAVTIAIVAGVVFILTKKKNKPPNKELP